MEQQCLDPFYLYQKEIARIYEENKLVKSKEKMEVVYKKTMVNLRCDACPEKGQERYYVYVGDVVILRLCKSCIRRFKRMFKK